MKTDKIVNEPNKQNRFYFCLHKTRHIYKYLDNCTWPSLFYRKRDDHTLSCAVSQVNLKPFLNGSEWMEIGIYPLNGNELRH